ncbi:sigma-54-dependent transcriptional regulator [Geosporobacter ferrireducens]|uniref:Stage 0 sporulation protein A homolog n=1 Tax=Geosporobacter ferrireducens TaxID=1424294 RepID=A0A1D8GDZ9_9FIRM|nr:sigma-54 dependent transcriptional regulator [Geosporobacter ferrireducens]AOT69139.1 two-component system response regulator [Geosporobacter ferrireducens]MTI56816.1 sigma-54-dependent Fis family transcriptional regulator [Geosporobacter ferrireducens]
MKKILIADDEKNMIWAMKKALKDERYRLITASDGEEAVKTVQAEEPDLILLDLRMPKMDGMEALREIRKINDKIPIIMLTAHGTMESAIEAMKLGALDYLSKPFDIDELKIIIEKALNIGNMQQQIEFLTEELQRSTGKSIIGTSDKIKAVLEIVNRVAVSNATVLITGESGTGKELIANAIHHNSNRKDKPYIKVNCGALPEGLLESELFGHEKGAFTGAIARKPGRFERAEGGTIFLDEVGELTPAVQVKLLRVLQEKEFERVGGVETIKADVRVIAATNRDLKEMVAQGTFREDLFYRLNVIPIELPPLRERKVDIPPLIDYFAEKLCKEMGRSKIRFDQEAIDILVNYPWQGNIRELENVIERIVILNQGEQVVKEVLPKEIIFQNSEVKDFILPEEGIQLEQLEKSFIEQALERTDHNQTQAAKLLGITRHTLIYRMEKHGIK